jgi:hypothetical protein
MNVNDAAYYTGAKAKVLHDEECRQCTSKAVEEERERCIEIVDRELDSNGQAQAIALAIRGVKPV